MAFVEAIDADSTIEMHGLMVLRHGHVIAEGCWAPHTADRPRQLYSLSKSFTATALGFALQEGLLGLDDTVVSHFPEFSEQITDPKSRSVTLRHVASMASGHNREMWDEAMVRDPQEPVRGFMLVPPDEAPGTLFAYSQPCTYTLASVIQRAAGTTLSRYLRPRLLDPLGIGEVGWQRWPNGDREQGFSGLFARIEDVAKLGLLYLQQGRWGERQLIPASFVAEATSRQIATHNDVSEDWGQGYGFGFWMSRHGYRGDGAFGQFCVVLPEQDVVVAITAGTEAMQAVLDHLWNHLLPGFGVKDAGGWCADGSGETTPGPVPSAVRGATRSATLGRLDRATVPRRSCKAEPDGGCWSQSKSNEEHSDSRSPSKNRPTRSPFRSAPLTG